ncbi:MAG: hypothetical protein WCZ19_01095 [Acholeplasma sp.]
MFFLKVRVEKYISYEQPGFVLCTFNDVNGRKWRIVEKVPVLTAKNFQEDSLPIEGFYVAGEILSEEDNIISFSISKPWGIETDDRETKFKIFRYQISEESSG